MAGTIYTAQGTPIEKPALQDGKVTVYNLATGEASLCHAIDAKERVSRGGWSYEAPPPTKTSRAKKPGPKK
jgi:hypothetical protein